MGICHRTIRHVRKPISPRDRLLKYYPKAPKALGDYLRKVRIEAGLSQEQLPAVLGLEVSHSAIEKWETGRNTPTKQNRQAIVAFIGFDPELTNPTGES